jgi:hypothetical protein
MPVCPIEDIVLIEATTESLDGFGTLISEPDACDIEIVQWPRPGWRPVAPLAPSMTARDPGG